jgi:signal transduction histidine kinase
MDFRSGFLESYRTERRPAARLEYVLAVARTFLTITGFLAIFFDPHEPHRLASITYAVLIGYATYSTFILALVRRASSVSRTHILLIHALDILWVGVLTFVSDGPISPFYLFFLFVALSAAYRWGLRETIGTVIVTVLVFLLQTAAAVAGPWPELLVGAQFEMDRTIFRVGYLLITGCLAGYLAEQEKWFRAEMAAIAEAVHQPRVELGLGGSVTALARMLVRMYRASAVDVVIYEKDTDRALLWQVTDGADDTSRNAARIEMGPGQERVWLFEDGASTWQANDVVPGARVRARAVQQGAWSLRSTMVQLPEGLPSRVCHTMTVANLGLGEEWRGRIFLYDPRRTGAVERRLHFLESFASQVTLALTNVVLLRRLRSQAGAAERARVARELHDGTIQALFGIEMKLQALRKNVDDHDVPLAAALADVQELLRAEILGVRELMQTLRPVELDGIHQLPDVLAGVVERFRRDSGISARFVSNVESIHLPSAASIEVVRIVQEALANVRKHSRARNVLVRLTGKDETYTLTVEDDGRGFDFEGAFSQDQLDRARLGPAIIKERTRLLGGQLTVESTRGAGARIEVTFGAPVHA